MGIPRKKLRVVHLLWTDNQWKPDDSAYKVFIPRKTQRSMPYQAIAAVPIIDNTNPGRCMGVLCLDSKDSKAFDSKKIKEGLSSVAVRISAIFLILENYNKRELVPLLIRLLSSLYTPGNYLR